MTMHHEQRPLGSIFSDLMRQMSELARTEVRLFSSETQEKLKTARNGLLEVVGGAVCLLAALLVLLQALVVALAEAGLGAGWASLVVGVVVAAIGYLLVRRGTANMSPSELVPERSLDQVRRDVDVAKEQVR